MSQDFLNHVGWFLSKEWHDAAPWGYDMPRAREAQKRGALFTPDQLKIVLPLWASVIEGQPRHEFDRLTIPTGGGEIQIAPGKISLPDEPSGEMLRASMAHAASQWGGKIAIPLDEDTTREFRIEARAYGQALGVEVFDCNDFYRDLKLTPVELARVDERAKVILETPQPGTPQRPPEASGGNRPGVGAGTAALRPAPA